MRGARLISGVLCGCSLGFAHPVAATITETTLTIGPEWTAVREVRRLQVAAGEQQIRLEGIPATADLSSLTIRTRRIPVDLLHWEREREAPALQRMSNGDLHFSRGDFTQPSSDQPPAADDGAVLCVIRFPLAGEQAFEITYRMRGLSWHAHYRVLLRGDLDSADERMSIDLDGLIQFENDSNRDFDNAWIRLAGADPLLTAHQELRLPGFLTLADTPLAELWQRPVPPVHPEHVYRLPRRVDLPAQAASEARFANAQRLPTSRRYVMDSHTIPLTLTRTFTPLRQHLVFANTTERGLGLALPPGDVFIYQGIAQRTLFRQGTLAHTGRGEDVRIDLGPTDQVTGMRRSRLRTAVRSDHYEEVFEIAVANHRPSAVQVDIQETPRLTLGWRVVQASEPHERSRGTLRFHPRVGAGEERVIEFRLRIQHPAP